MTRVQRRRSLPLATVGAVAATAVTWALAQSTVGLTVVVGTGAVTVPLGAVVLATALGGGAAAFLQRLAARRTDPRRCYLSWCAQGLVVSSVPPVVFASTVGTAAMLLLLHAVAASVIVPAGLPSLDTAEDAA